MLTAAQAATYDHWGSRDRGRAARHLRLVVPRSIRVVIADHFELHRAGLRALLEGEQDITVVGEAAGGADATGLCRTLRPDVMVLDHGWPESDAAWPGLDDGALAHVGVLILAASTTCCPSAATHPGGCRLLAKDSTPAALVRAVRELAGQPQFATQRRDDRLFAETRGKPVLQLA